MGIGGCPILATWVKYMSAVADGGSHAYPDSVVQESILAYLMSKSSDPVTTSYNNTTDSLEMLSDKLGALTGDGGTDYNDSVLSLIKVLSKYVADGDGDFATGSVLPANTSIYDVLVGSVAAVNRQAGKEQVKATTINLAQAAASYTLLTGTTQDVIIESLLIRLPAVNVSDDATITSISIQTNDATPQVFVNSVVGAKAYLTSEAQLGWTGTSLLKTGKLIQLTIAGGAADAASVCDVVVRCRAIVSGGYLA